MYSYTLTVDHTSGAGQGFYMITTELCSTIEQDSSITGDSETATKRPDIPCHSKGFYTWQLILPPKIQTGLSWSFVVHQSSHFGKSRQPTMCVWLLLATCYHDVQVRAGADLPLMCLMCIL